MTMEKGGPSLDDAGTPESAWSAWRLHQLPALELGNYRGAVLVAPHPDDEVLAAGGLRQRLSDRGIGLAVVSVTDDEASHSHSATMSPLALADVRSLERCQALDHLGVSARILPAGAPGRLRRGPVR
jgi:hypothetical protein